MRTVYYAYDGQVSQKGPECGGKASYGITEVKSKGVITVVCLQNISPNADRMPAPSAQKIINNLIANKQ